MAVRKKTAAKKPGTAVANIDAELQKEVATINERIGASESRAISIKDKMFTLPDQQPLKEPLEIVIIDFLAWNRYFLNDYDSKNPEPPVCWALGQNPGKLVPSANVGSRQNDDCTTCRHNEFGSGRGEGKACKNQRMLAVMLTHDDPAEGPIYTLSVPPTGLKNFDGYVASVARVFNAPPIKVVTKVHFHPEANYPTLLFGGPEPNPHVNAHFARRAEARQLLETEPDSAQVAQVLASSKPAKPAKRPARKRA